MAFFGIFLEGFFSRKGMQKIRRAGVVARDRRFAIGKFPVKKIGGSIEKRSQLALSTSRNKLS